MLSLKSLFIFKKSYLTFLHFEYTIIVFIIYNYLKWNVSKYKKLYIIKTNMDTIKKSFLFSDKNMYTF